MGPVLPLWIPDFFAQITNCTSLTLKDGARLSCANPGAPIHLARWATTYIVSDSRYLIPQAESRKTHEGDMPHFTRCHHLYAYFTLGTIPLGFDYSFPQAEVWVVHRTRAAQGTSPGASPGLRNCQGGKNGRRSRKTGG